VSDASADLVTVPPRRLVVGRNDGGDAPSLLVTRRRRYVWPGVACAAAPVGYMLGLNLVGVLVALVAVTWTLSLYAPPGRVVIGATQIVGESGPIALAEIEVVEVVGSLNAELRVRRSNGQTTVVFTGSHTHAEWLAAVIRHVKREGRVPVPPPEARALPPRPR